MAVSLGGIGLPDLVVEGEHARTGVQAKVKTTLGGQVLVWEQPLGGKPIDLTGGKDWGWIDKSTLDALLSLARAPGAAYSLDYEGRISTVRFRHEDPPVIEAAPIIPRPNAQGEDNYYQVRIRLMEVD